MRACAPPFAASKESPHVKHRHPRVPRIRRLPLALALILPVVAASCGRTHARQGSAAPPQERSAGPMTALDLDGKPTDPFAVGAAHPIVFVFISDDCPICNRYTPEIRRLRAEFYPQGVRFWLVHPAADELPQAIRQHARDYQIDCPELRDPNHVLVRRAEASVTPEAALFTAGGKLVYHGRIDDQFTDFGKQCPQPTSMTLEQAIAAVIAGQTCSHRQDSRHRLLHLRGAMKSSGAWFRAIRKPDPWRKRVIVGLALAMAVVVAGVGAAVRIALEHKERVPITRAPHPPTSVTFDKDIAPIVLDHCAICHHPGQSAPFSLLTFQDVREARPADCRGDS